MQCDDARIVSKRLGLCRIDHQRVNTPVPAKLPTLDESGLKGFNVSIFHALYAPKGTPADVLDRLNKALRGALRDPEFIKRQERAWVRWS